MSDPTSGPTAPGGARPAGAVFSVDRVLRATWSTYFANVVPFTAIAAVLESPALALNAYVVLSRTRDLTPNVLLAFSLLSVLVALITHLIIVGTLSVGVFRHLRGQSFGWLECLARGLAKSPAAFGTAVISGLAAALGYLLCIVPGIYVYAVAVPAAVIEGKGPLVSMARSKSLTLGHRWAVFGAIFLVGLALAIPSMVIMLLLVEHVMLAIVLTSLWTIVSVTFQAVLSSVLYYTLREAREDLDAPELAAAFD